MVRKNNQNKRNKMSLEEAGRKGGEARANQRNRRNK